MLKLEEDECPACSGVGQVVKASPRRLGEPLLIAPPCPDCNGTGKRPRPVAEGHPSP
jgi:DnaJ-class molecular chaperone